MDISEESKTDFYLKWIIGISAVLVAVMFLPVSESAIPPTPAFDRICSGGSCVVATAYNQIVNLVAGTGVTITPNDAAKTMTISASGAGLSEQYCSGTDKFRAYNATDNVFICAPDNSASGENTSAVNIGSGLGVFATEVGDELRFNSLIAGQGIDITDTTDDLTIATDFLATSITCTGTDKISAFDSSTGDFTCSTDEEGGASRVVLGSNVQSTSNSVYTAIFTIPLTANSNHSVDFDLISQTSLTTVGIQFRGRVTQAASVGMCSFVSVSSASAFLFDNIAVSTNPADTGDTAELTANPQPDRIYCTVTTGATAGNLVLEFQSETGGAVNVLAGSNYRLIIDS